LLGSSGSRANSPCGLRHARLLIRLPLRYSPPHNGERDRMPDTEETRTRHGASLLAVLSWLLGLFRRVAGLSSAAAGGSGRALSERSEFSPTPPDASSARNRAAALTSAALLFGDFLLGKQEKVTALSGAYPDTSSLPGTQSNATNSIAFGAITTRQKPQKSPHEAGFLLAGQGVSSAPTAARTAGSGHADPCGSQPGSADPRRSPPAPDARAAHAPASVLRRWRPARLPPCPHRS